MNHHDLAKQMGREPDGPRRDLLEERYWALVEERYGPKRADHWRWEYEWLRKAAGHPVTTCHTCHRREKKKR